MNNTESIRAKAALEALRRNINPALYTDLISEIALDPETAYQYARYTTHERFPEGEAAIATSSYHSWRYAVEVIEGRFYLGEAAIATHSYHAARYASAFMYERWLEAEPAIIENPMAVWLYCYGAIHARLYEGEAVLMSDLALYIDYVQLYKYRCRELEDAIITGTLDGTYGTCAGGHLMDSYAHRVSWFIKPRYWKALIKNWWNLKLR